MHEGMWFKKLHPLLSNSELKSFPVNNVKPKHIVKALSYDRPDIILADGEKPILVLERTIEVPSGHNVGQRFARLVAAARMGIPSVYLGPYVAYKHGGATQGPRYMNLRLFYALKNMADIEKTAITVINWPVDDDCEIIRTPEKDIRVKEYLGLFLDYYSKNKFKNISKYIMKSEYEKQQEKERDSFIAERVAKPQDYDNPPGSVVVGKNTNISEFTDNGISNLRRGESVLYKVGMRYIRSDPYTGMAMLYSYLYCNGLNERKRNLILHFPHITKGMWRTAAKSKRRKDIRLFRMAADGILFKNGYLSKTSL